MWYYQQTNVSQQILNAIFVVKTYVVIYTSTRPSFIYTGQSQISCTKIIFIYEASITVINYLIKQKIHWNSKLSFSDITKVSIRVTLVTRHEIFKRVRLKSYQNLWSQLLLLSEITVRLDFQKEVCWKWKTQFSTIYTLLLKTMFWRIRSSFSLASCLQTCNKCIWQTSELVLSEKPCVRCNVAPHHTDILGVRSGDCGVPVIIPPRSSKKSCWDWIKM